MKELGYGPYAEVDLLVPEFVAQSTLARDEAWFPLVTKIASPDHVALIERGGGAYIILLRKGVRNPPPAQAGAPPKTPAVR
jgi:hypothetical protein